MSGSGIQHLTDDTFDAGIRAASGPVLVDFWADWCGPCRSIAPALEEVASELAGIATVAQVDVDANGSLVGRFGIRSIPTLLVFKEGRVVDQVVGAVPKDQLKRLLEKHVG